MATMYQTKIQMIEALKDHEFTTTNITEEVIKFLEELYIEENPDEFTITWCTDDVLEEAKNNGYKLTQEQGRAILGLAAKYHDCNIGMSWETLDVWIWQYCDDNGVEKTEITEDED